jgi:hypothetical protein
MRRSRSLYKSEVMLLVANVNYIFSVYTYDLSFAENDRGTPSQRYIKKRLFCHLLLSQSALGINPSEQDGILRATSSSVYDAFDK